MPAGESFLERSLLRDRTRTNDFCDAVPAWNDPGTVEVLFDFIQHQLLLETSDGRVLTIALKPQSVAEFYKKFMSALAELGVTVKIWTTPCEIPDPDSI